jgi:hypothetical protein
MLSRRLCELRVQRDPKIIDLLVVLSQKVAIRALETQLLNEIHVSNRS